MKVLSVLFLVLVISLCVAFSPPRIKVGRSLGHSQRLISTSLNSGLHEAAQYGDMEWIDEQLSDHPEWISHYDIDGQLMLHFAAKAGHIDLVKYLVEKGPGYINFKNIRYRTPLYWAAQNAGTVDNCEEIAMYLIEHGADINTVSKDEITPYEKAKKGPLGKAFADRMKAAAEGITPRPVDLAMNRVYWG